MLTSLARRLSNRLRERTVRSNCSVSVGVDTKISWATVRGKGTLRVGDRSILESPVTFERDGATLTLGARSFWGAGVVSVANSISVGDDVLVAFGCTIMDHDSHSLRWIERRDDVAHWFHGHKNWEHVRSAPIVVESKAWIGCNSILLKGVTIGEGAVIAAGSVVTRSVEPWTLVAGNPATVKRKLETP